ncbi:hypothetical protein [Hymenobacter armeniacus]|uniref:Uncharacterized protein n=1 Tax=Hymenobacter armeniacus TaxID=2771358 RepID=A0ABR8JL21_9BACT|nr:hypothetical protein [Hymenobacter armeniacus]MBD2720697.1 hypothetical protein [Hymenobacter armeniacus]
MLANFQHHFRFYLALILSVLLAAGVRLQAAPLGAAPQPAERTASPAAATETSGLPAAR